MVFGFRCRKPCSKHNDRPLALASPGDSARSGVSIADSHAIAWIIAGRPCAESRECESAWAKTHHRRAVRTQRAGSYVIHRQLEMPIRVGPRWTPMWVNLRGRFTLCLRRATSRTGTSCEQPLSNHLAASTCLNSRKDKDKPERVVTFVRPPGMYEAGPRYRLSRQLRTSRFRG